MSEKESKYVERQIPVFFYGSFIRKEIMALGGIAPQKVEIVRLYGYNITFAPHAKIYRSAAHCVVGILIYATHRQLKQLYSRDGVGTFLPEAVTVVDQGFQLQSALCYISPDFENAPPDMDYVRKIIDAATAYGFPGWYLRHLNAFIT